MNQSNNDSRNQIQSTNTSSVAGWTPVPDTMEMVLQHEDGRVAIFDDDGGEMYGVAEGPVPIEDAYLLAKWGTA